jgi:hypothetical protein
MFAVMQVQQVLCDMVCWLLEVRERVCRIEGAVARLRTEVDELRKEVARLKQKVRYEELLAKVRYQELVLAGALHRPSSDAANAACASAAAWSSGSSSVEGSPSSLSSGVSSNF